MVNDIVQLILMYSWMTTGIMLLNQLVRQVHIQVLWVHMFVVPFLAWMAVRMFA